MMPGFDPHLRRFIPLCGGSQSVKPYDGRGTCGVFPLDAGHSLMPAGARLRHSRLAGEGRRASPMRGVWGVSHPKNCDTLPFKKKCSLFLYN
ncbi:hypothetical protein Hdeb2414_s0021g00577531 [Helianthus debilis subsp. tardiflorus]